MMQDIEKLFRESLSDAELPYEAGAWEAMSAKLGPPKAPASASNAKWYVAAAAVTVAAGIAVIAALSSDKPALQKSAAAAPVVSTVTTQRESAADQKHVHSGNKVQEPAAVSPQATVADGVQVNSQTTHVDNQAVVTAPAPGTITGIATTTPADPEDRKTPPVPARLMAVTVPAHICSNEPVVISNPNASDIWVKLPGEDVKTVKGKQKATFTASKAGDIIISNGELTQKIEVSQGISPDIVGYSQLTYENGIPQLSFSTSARLDNISWSANVPAAETNDGFILHPYHEEKVTVKLTGIDFNGCKVSEERTIAIPDPHNLLAAEAFRPESSISTNQYFMPFTLTQRDTPFELFIFDVKNGAQVFSTRDASKGWDGHDSRNGELVPVNSVWVWKVILKNPMPGETPVYSGTITRL